MLKKLLLAISLILVFSSSSCAEEDISTIVNSIYKAAQKKDTSFFDKYVSSKGQIAKIMDMISKSSMMQNYKSRMEKRTGNTIQLNYHWFEKSLHFQIYLKKINSKWEIDRIFMCR